MEEASKLDEDISIAILPDHATPCEIRTHTHDAVPFIIYNPNLKADDVSEYTEDACSKGGFGGIEEDEFMRSLLG
jgi:2,3-bisphosphoglycerate-independent phosphoglycerate mutase